MAGLRNLKRDLPRRGGGYRKADTHIAASRRKDRGVHANDPARAIEQRTTLVAAVDRGIDLQKIIVRPRPDFSPTCRYDA